MEVLTEHQMNTEKRVREILMESKKLEALRKSIFTSARNELNHNSWASNQSSIISLSIPAEETPKRPRKKSVVIRRAKIPFTYNRNRHTSSIMKLDTCLDLSVRNDRTTIFHAEDLFQTKNSFDYMKTPLDQSRRFSIKPKGRILRKPKKRLQHEIQARKSTISTNRRSSLDTKFHLWKYNGSDKYLKTEIFSPQEYNHF